MNKTPQPASKSYFFDKGYRDLASTVVGAWVRNKLSIDMYIARLKNLSGRSVPAKIWWGILNVVAIIAVVVCGSAVTAVISAANILILLVFMAIVYVGFSVIWLVDRLYLSFKKISVACPVCKEHFLIPTYICPKCGAKHTNLTPGVYGILHRTCNCGEKLPTTFFNGRKDLPAVCPSCSHALSDRENRLVCIPVVGGRSVGKTAYITAFSKQFIEQVAPQKGLEVEMYDQKKEAIYKDITRDYAHGSTRMTERPQDINVPSSVSFSFFIKNPALSPERLFHIYDIAGEVFTDNNENEVQQQYEYCQGIVFMVDPFSIPTVAAEFEECLEPEDRAGIGTADLNGIIDSFINKIRQVTGLRDNQMANIPLAVVIGKIDSACLNQDIGDMAVRKAMRNAPARFTDYYDTQDYLCRKFLREHDMGSFLSAIDLKFKSNRFFACSAIGHTRDKGEYHPEGVLAPVEWLLQTADPKLAQLWSEHTFNKKKMEETV